MFEETICVSLTIIVIAILVTFVYYKLKLKRLSLIEKGLWKSEYEEKQLESIVVAGAILMAIGVAVLLCFMIEDTKLFLKALIGLVPLLIGIALVVCFLMHRHMASRGRNRNQ